PSAKGKNSAPRMASTSTPRPCSLAAPSCMGASSCPVDRDGISPSPRSRQRASDPMHRSSRRLTILDLCVLVACFAVGLWLAVGLFRESGPSDEEGWVAIVVYLLGGLSLAGPPLLLRKRLVTHARLRIGELFWFCQGTASWLLWPPI